MEVYEACGILPRFKRKQQTRAATETPPEHQAPAQTVITHLQDMSDYIAPIMAMPKRSRWKGCDRTALVAEMERLVSLLRSALDKLRPMAA